MTASALPATISSIEGNVKKTMLIDGESRHSSQIKYFSLINNFVRSSFKKKKKHQLSLTLETKVVHFYVAEALHGMEVGVCLYIDRQNNMILI